MTDMTTFAVTTLSGMFIALVLCAGGIWALLKQKTVVDKAGNVTEIEIPVLGKLKTNYPSLGAILIGAGLAVFVIERTPAEQDKRSLTARLLIDKTQPNSTVIVAAIPRRYFEPLNTFTLGQQSSVSFDVDAADTYSVVAFMPNPVRPDASFSYAVVHGPARLDEASDGFVFENKLIGDN